MAWAPADRAFLGATLVFLALDQVSKRAMAAWLSVGEHVDLVGRFFALCHYENDAAAFGMLGDVDDRQLLYRVLTVFFSLALVAFQRVMARDDARFHGLLGLLFAGVLGNFVDRLERGSVTDFLLFRLDVEPWRTQLLESVGTYTWPAFNFADAYLSIAVVLLLAHVVFGEAEDTLTED